MSAPSVSKGSDLVFYQKYVLSIIGGRAYRSKVPLKVRVPVMIERVKGQNPQVIAKAQLVAQSVANYLKSIGDIHNAERWSEMALDLQLAYPHTDQTTCKVPKNLWE